MMYTSRFSHHWASDMQRAPGSECTHMEHASCETALIAACGSTLQSRHVQAMLICCMMLSGPGSALGSLLIQKRVLQERVHWGRRGITPVLKDVVRSTTLWRAMLQWLRSLADTAGSLDLLRSVTSASEAWDTVKGCTQYYYLRL